jgi:hypothetical protein
VRASSTGLFKLQKMESVGGLEQTRVSWVMQLGLCGAIPQWVSNRQGVSMLMYLSVMREKFDRSDEIDLATTRDIEAVMLEWGRDK